MTDINLLEFDLIQVFGDPAMLLCRFHANRMLSFYAPGLSNPSFPYFIVCIYVMCAPTEYLTLQHVF